MVRKSRFAIRRYESLEAMKADEYAYWRQRPGHERIAAVSELTREAYGLKDLRPDVPRLQRTLVQLNDSKVKYLVVGGYAVSFHAQPRATKDLVLLTHLIVHRAARLRPGGRE
jgi:hypothetical protein